MKLNKVLKYKFQSESVKPLFSEYIPERVSGVNTVNM